MSDLDVDVLLVGAGPVGMLGGILASRHGLTSLVVERRDGPQRAPAAHVVNARTYEICRQAGLDMERIHTAGQDRADAGHVNFVTRLTGDLIGRLPFERQDDGCLDVTPTPLRNLSQHRFEPILADELLASPGADLRYRHQWERSEETGPSGDGVLSDVVDLDTGSTLRVRSRWVIGCDGAGSRVRKQLAIEMEGPPLIQCFLAIHFAADLRELTADRPAVLHFVLDPEAAGTFIAHDVESDWVFMVGIDPEHETVADFDDARCRAVLDAAAGTTIDAQILGTGTWWMSSQTAPSMGRGRILLAGDAAHRFPPTGGLGLNSGMQDIHGLMWRLAAITQGRAAPGLLDSYEVERIPVAKNNALQSLTNALKLVHLAEALGIDVDPTSERLQNSLADPANAEAIAAAVEIQREHFDLLGLQLGYVYSDGAVVPEPATVVPGTASVFVPSAMPGARLPHAWIPDGSGRSTLDLVPVDRPVLFSFGGHDAWAGALEGASGTAGLEHVRVGSDTPALEPWRETCEVGEAGALLVRPDQHVAWRAWSLDEIGTMQVALAVLAGGTCRACQPTPNG